MIEIAGYKLSKFDERNWIVEKKSTVKTGKHKGAVVWTGRKFFPKLEQACLALFDVLMDDDERWGFGQMEQQIEDAKEEIIDQLKEIEVKK